MFVGHYGVSFLARSKVPQVPLWVFFLATQFLDLLWVVLVLTGLEGLQIIPGITAASPLDLEHAPYSHSLLAVTIWSLLTYVVACRFPGGAIGRRAALWVSVAVFSHWWLDLIVHRPDLPFISILTRWA